MIGRRSIGRAFLWLLFFSGHFLDLEPATAPGAALFLFCSSLNVLSMPEPPSRRSEGKLTFTKRTFTIEFQRGHYQGVAT